jgi:hypothetical protein
LGLLPVPGGALTCCLGVIGKLGASKSGWKATLQAEAGEHLAKVNALRQIAGKGNVDNALARVNDFLERSDKKIAVFAPRRAGREAAGRRSAGDDGSSAGTTPRGSKRVRRCSSAILSTACSTPTRSRRLARAVRSPRQATSRSS